MKKMTMILLLLAGFGLSGCDVPEWANVQVDFYDGQGSYLNSREVNWANQSVVIPREAVTMEVAISSRKMSGKRLPFDYEVAAVDNADGFRYVWAEGHYASDENPLIVSRVIRDWAGNPMLNKLQCEVSLWFTVDGPYYIQTPWMAHRSFTATPEELISPGKVSDEKNWKVDWGGVLSTLLATSTTGGN